MSANLAEFQYGRKPIRTMDCDGEVWFVARDVCDALGIVWQGDKTITRIRPDWKMVAKYATISGEKDTILISEPAVFKLAFRSHKSEAEEFTDWVAGEVLPAIRKTGSFNAAKTPAIAQSDLPNQNKIRYAKMCLVSSLMRLEQLGIDVDAIDFRIVIRFGRQLARF